MSIPTNTAHFVCTGGMPSGEVFATGFWAEAVTPPATLSDFQSLTNAVATCWETMWNSLVGYRPVGVTPDTLHGYWYGVVVGPPSATYTTQTTLSVNPGTGTLTLPDQCAVVASLRTGLAGRSYRGRMYLPLLAAAVGANAQLDNSTVQAIANAVGTMMSDAQVAGATPVVMSARQTANTPLTDVVVDSIVDTQRRRRNKLLPAHSYAHII